MLIAEDLLCNKTHQYVSKKEGFYLIGVTDHFLKKMSEIIFLDLPEAGMTFQKDEVFGTLQDVNSSKNLYMPIGGTVLEVNETIVDNFDDLSENSWLIKISSDTAFEDSVDLYDYEDYLDLCLG